VKPRAPIAAQIVAGRDGVVRIEQRVKEIVGIAVVAVPAGQSQFVLARHQMLEMLVHVPLLDRHLNADFPEGILHITRDRRRLLKVRTGLVHYGQRQAQRKLEAPLGCGARQEFLRCLGVVARHVECRFVGPHVGRHHRQGGQCMAGIAHGDERLLVDRHINGPADPQIVERPFFQLHRQIGDVHADLLLHDQPRVVGQRIHFHWRQVLGHMHFAAGQALHAGCVFLDGHPHEVVDLRPPAVIIVVGGAHQLLVAHPFDEAERSGAYRMLGEIGAVPAQRRRADDAGRKHGQVRQQDRAGVVQLKNHRVLVRRLDRPDHVVARLVRPGFVECQLVLWLDQPLEAYSHRLAVARRTVVKDDPRPQVKCPGETVLAVLPPLGQSRDDIGRLVVIRHQRIKQVRDDVHRLGNVGVDRVQGCGVFRLGIDQRLAAGGGAAVPLAATAAAGQQQRQNYAARAIATAKHAKNCKAAVTRVLGQQRLKAPARCRSHPRASHPRLAAGTLPAAAQSWAEAPDRSRRPAGR
jgi:hypothetical protein